MRQLKRKLRSNAGASMIFAMVFLLFCVFIGGSVLAAATANAGRVAKLTTDQQEYLSQRSAALVMADMLTGTEDAPMQLVIREVKKEEIETVTADDGTVTTNIVPISNDGTFSLETKNGAVRSVLQRVLIENAVQRYRAVKVNLNNLVFEGFVFANTVTGEKPGESKLLDTNDDSVDTFQISDQMGGTHLVRIVGAEKVTQSTTLTNELFDMDFAFVVEETGEGNTKTYPDISQVYVDVNAYYSTGDPIVVTRGDIVTTTTTTIIRWDDPVIEKGGVS